MARPTITSALRLSALLLLSFVGYTLMEMRYFLGSWIPGDLAAMLEALFVMAVVGSWLLALAFASAGKKGGLAALLGLTGLAFLIAVYDRDIQGSIAEHFYRSLPTARDSRRIGFGVGSISV
jgi:hypothetical protein